MEVDDEEVETPSSSTSKSGEKKRFEVKKVSHVSCKYEGSWTSSHLTI